MLLTLPEEIGSSNCSLRVILFLIVSLLRLSLDPDWILLLCLLCDSRSRFDCSDPDHTPAPTTRSLLPESLGRPVPRLPRLKRCGSTCVSYALLTAVPTSLEAVPALLRLLVATGEVSAILLVLFISRSHLLLLKTDSTLCVVVS